MLNNVYLGIDPGRDGFFCLINNDKELITSLRMPNTGNGIDSKTIFEFLNDLNTQYGKHLYIALEEIHAVRGSAAGSTFTFGRNYEAVFTCLKIISLNFILVPPSEWQPVAWEGIEKQYSLNKSGRKKHETKKTSHLAALAIFPSIDFRISKRATTAHDGKIDALLISEFLRRKTIAQWQKK